MLAVRCVSPTNDRTKTAFQTWLYSGISDCNNNEIPPSKQEKIYFAPDANFDTGAPEKQLVLSSVS